MSSPFSRVVPNFGFSSVRDAAFAAVRKLWAARQEQGWTQADLAERLGKDPGWVSRKLSGPTNWTLHSLGDLADAMNAEVEITLHDLETKTDRSNFDAYAAFDAEERSGETLLDSRKMTETGSLSQTGRHFEAVVYQ